MASRGAKRGSWLDFGRIDRYTYSSVTGGLSMPSNLRETPSYPVHRHTLFRDVANDVEQCMSARTNKWGEKDATPKEVTFADG